MMEHGAFVALFIMFGWLVDLGFRISFACVCTYFARKKGYRKSLFWWFGFALGPIALIITLFVFKNRNTGKRPL